MSFYSEDKEPSPVFKQDPDFWYELYKQFKQTLADTLTQIAFGNLQTNNKILSAENPEKTVTNEFKNRSFLLNEKCVSNEIFLHLKGFLWGSGYNVQCPIVFKGYCIKEGIFSTKDQKSTIKIACQEADIYEADVLYHKDEAAIYGFNYYSGIAQRYKNTSNDPYYNTTSKKRKSNYVREGWVYEKIE